MRRGARDEVAAAPVAHVSHADDGRVPATEPEVGFPSRVFPGVAEQADERPRLAGPEEGNAARATGQVQLDRLLRWDEK